MMDVTINADVARLMEGISRAQREQVPFALARSMTRAAYEARDSLKDEMQRALDRPTRWTLNSVKVKGAKKNDLSVRVWLMEDAPRGNAAGDYLKPLTYGEPRAPKRMEQSLDKMSVMAAGYRYAVPARGQRLNASGNLTRARINKALESVRAGGNGRYFAKATDTGLPAGIWERKNKRKVKPFMIFTKNKPRYSNTFEFDSVARSSFSDKLNADFPSSLADAMADAF